MAKGKCTKSEQSISPFVPVIRALKIRDTLRSINLQEHENRKEAGDTPVDERKTLSEIFFNSTNYDHTDKRM